jgi:hypothetical protein
MAGALARAAVHWRQGQDDRAWSALMTLSPGQRREPQAAFWVALVASDLGRRSEAIDAIAAARELPLPGEQAVLLQSAEQRLP